MLTSKKWQTDDGDGLHTHDVTCIIHKNGIKYLKFIPFSDIDGFLVDKLGFLLGICDKHLSLPCESSYHMENVCNQIPESTDGKELTYVGYHRGCYQHFTKNLDRLPKSQELQPSDVASALHSPWWSSTSSGNKPLFPPECIFCGKLGKKLSGRTERCTKFPVFKAQDGSFKNDFGLEFETSLAKALH